MATERLSQQTRARLIAGAGWTIMVIGLAAALLPLTDRPSRGLSIGLLLFAAGLVETGAGLLRRGARNLPLVAGIVTMLAGLLFMLYPLTHFLPVTYVVVGWLLLRSLILLLASRFSGGSVRMWMGLSAATDLVLGLVLLAGLSIGTLVVSLFGPTPTLVASFAWVFAFSFVVTGVLLLEVGACEQDAAA